MQYTHNSDLNYYKNHPEETNCGSFALRLKEWYLPETDFEKEVGDIEKWILTMAKEGYNEVELSDIYLDAIVTQILKDFEGEIEICDGRAPYTEEKELIALSTYCFWDYDYSWADWDFHFKVFRDGVWQEKHGDMKVEECDLEEWDRYIGDIIYFYHRIKKEN